MADSDNGPKAEGEPCTCDACNTLNTYYESDPQLLRFYRKRLLVRGWAGQKTPMEKAYILAHAPFAQAAAAAGAGTRLHVSNPAVQECPSAGVVLEDLATVEAAP